MRVALVCDWFLPRMGGIELHLRDLALALRRAGVDAHIVTSTRGAAVVEDIPVHRLAVPLAPGAGFAITPRLRRSISRLVEAERFDLVHSHASVVSPVAFAALGTGLPTVLTFHSMLYRVSMMLGATDALLGWSRGIVLTAVSSVVATQAVRWMPGADVAVLPNAVDARFWSDAAGPEVRAPVHFVSAMRLSRKKRPLRLVRAFADAVRFVAGAPLMRLTVAGDGPDRDEAQRLSSELGVGDLVAFPGQLTRPQLRELYRSAHAFVLPSERESFGIAALEARAAGLPVIAMLESGARDFIAPGVNGLLANDEQELARFISRVALEEPLRCFMRARNQLSPMEYDWSAAVQLHRRYYDAAVALRDAPVAASHT